MRILIIDDEELARAELGMLLAREADVEIVGECSNAVEGIAAIHRLQPDAVFLDIQMPRISGLEMLGMIDPERMPRIVFLTAYEEYALRAFDANAFDYLLKPVQEGRIAKTLDRLRRPAAGAPPLPAEAAQALRHIPCTGLNRIRLMKIDEVEAIVSRTSGVYVLGTDGEEHFTELTLRTLEERTPLMRCHRQYMVNADRIRDIAFGEGGLASIVTVGGRTIPVSRRFLGVLKERLGIG
ncbi:two-component system response regulator BtsR [Rhodoplanes sp. TEM]|uniref:Two-component system response regulator BtsR n=1 Tax=Rhodoplanes tepidamans TaxID=200616 RepID=A0ABT5J696_RHOTP|nr:MULTISPECIES: two-component system response regulator BtsR [Rhodoplanes]MDC7785175.1 two-component system response regulator BtsR [Rhodoplanes tepidamans]MDC7987125.1 two-component system response regulator BtsR [Rhodoplanes sp. TEM]MDQ0353432.1 two-component system LytT family response regulator [Rhodoplanes tepidamans]